ncbi:MAG: polar amino acid transport system substrate-binding protein [Acidobacteriota bacterium]|jgi:polar amino acid transport system substrate-binding protein|nr:polar amino acid transport system substrate-binding protein [Acidobacteriota bacterium]
MPGRLSPKAGPVLGLVLAATLLLVGAAAAGDLAAVQARGKLILLCHPVQDSPFVAANLDVMRERGLKLSELTKPEELTGAEIELARGFARKLGVGLEVHVVVESFDALLAALRERQGDLAASELTITPKRLETVDFSTPYVSDWLAVVTRRGSPIAALAGLQGKKGVVVGGTSLLEFLRAAAPEVQVALTNFDLESLEAVEHGEADFTLVDTSVPVGGSLDALHPGLKVAFRLREFGDAMAVRKGSDLLPRLDGYLKGLKKSGELKRILDRNGVQAEKKSVPPTPRGKP